MGQVLLDGHDLHGVTLASLRGQVAQVQQETFLFSSSVLGGGGGASNCRDETSRG
jgi:ABC-type multidrug transport system fused ATPase/permease subunit